MSAQKLRLGFVGIGVMGKSMCKHLINAGHSLSIYNRTVSKCEPLSALGAKIAASPKEIGANSDIVFSIVGYPHDVEDIILGANGILKGAQSGTIIVDMTTSEPSLAKKIYQEALKKKVYTLDAPVSGGDVGAANATLSIMVGGDQKVFDKVLPLFQVMGKNIKYMGPAGSGQHTKMVNQTLIASNMIGVCEGLLYAHQVGLNLEETIKAVGSGAAGSFSINTLGPRMIKGDFDPGFFVEHFIKDMGIALSEAKKMNLSLPGLALAHQLYIALQAQGHRRKGTQALILALETLSGKHDFAQLQKDRQSKL